MTIELTLMIAGAILIGVIVFQVQGRKAFALYYQDRLRLAEERLENAERRAKMAIVGRDYSIQKVAELTAKLRDVAAGMKVERDERQASQTVIRRASLAFNEEREKLMRLNACRHAIVDEFLRDYVEEEEADEPDETEPRDAPADPDAYLEVDDDWDDSEDEE